MSSKEVQKKREKKKVRSAQNWQIKSKWKFYLNQKKELKNRYQKRETSRVDN